MDSSDLNDILAAVRRFIREEVVPAEDEIEETDAIPARLREQAAAMERTRRKEALEKALQGHQRTVTAGDGSLMDVDASIASGAPAPENGLETSNSAPPPVAELVAGVGGEDSTMKMMEELMEELISFQERFGPGAKVKERDRRAGTL